jgi:hypothetical protein
MTIANYGNSEEQVFQAYAPIVQRQHKFIISPKGKLSAIGEKDMKVS